MVAPTINSPRPRATLRYMKTNLNFLGRPPLPLLDARQRTTERRVGNNEAIRRGNERVQGEKGRPTSAASPARGGRRNLAKRIYYDPRRTLRPCASAGSRTMPLHSMSTGGKWVARKKVGPHPGHVRSGAGVNARFVDAESPGTCCCFRAMRSASTRKNYAGAEILDDSMEPLLPEGLLSSSSI